MLKQYLDSLRGECSTEEFVALMQMVTDDVKFNRLGFGKKTSSKDIIDIIKNSMPLLNSIVA